MKKTFLFKERRMRKGRAIFRAQGLVEFALVLPVILITLFVLVELARVLHAWLAIENGARAGVRYAVTAEYNPDHCPPTGCVSDQDKKEARVASIHDAAWAGSSSIVRVGWDDAEPDQASYFDVIVCDPKNLIEPASTFDTYSCTPGENPGDPGQQVVVVVEFNHPLISPLLTSIWPRLRLDAKREAIVETYRIPQPVGTAPVYNSPTPRPTNTPLPTNTPPGPIPPPSCDRVWYEFQGNATEHWVKAVVKGYGVGGPPPPGIYQMTVPRIQISQDNRDPAAKIDKFEWVTWNEGGGSSTRTDIYHEPPGYYDDYYPDPPYNVGHCYPGGCADVHYMGVLTTYFDRALTRRTIIGIKVSFPEYGITCSTRWWSYYPPGAPRDTPEPYISNTPNPNPEPTNTPTQPWIPPEPSDTPDPHAPPD